MDEVNIASFLNNVSHELRTPLHAITGMTDLLLESNLTDEQQSYVTTINSCTDSILALVEDLIDSSRLQDHKLQLNMIQMDMRNVLNLVLDMARVSYEAKGLKCTYEVSDNFPQYLRGDPHRIRQIIANLVSNAIKFTDKGHIAIRVSAEEDSLYNEKRQWNIIISVEDTGMGIREQDIPLLMNTSYVQLNNDQEYIYGGVGLGLMITKNLIELMGGRIWVESTFGSGTIFYVSFSLIEDTDYDTLKAQYSSFLRGKHILAIDDNITSRLLLSGMILEWGCVPIVCGTAKEALSFVKTNQNHVDVALIDYRMPDMMGNIIAQKILDVRSDIPLLCLSSQEGVMDKHLFKDTLVRPINKMRLLHSVVYALKDISVIHDSDINDTHVNNDLNILVVEDIVDNQKLIVLFLEKLGYKNVKTAFNGKQGLEALEQHPEIDVIFADIRMPVMDGYEMSREIRRLYPQRKIYIVAVTALVNDDVLSKCKKAGMDSYLPKPLRKQKLAVMLESISDEMAKK
jgi:CheY-like chemotaxis protein